MSKHSKGPWEIDSSNGAVLRDARNRAIASFDMGNKDEAEIKANIALASLAPDMKQALADVLDYFGPRDRITDLRELEADIRTLLAKLD